MIAPVHMILQFYFIS